MRAKPFVKWAGGKSKIVNKLTEFLPPNTKELDYYEPFIGGGACFFKWHDKFKNCFISDINEELIDTYQVVKDDVWKLIYLLHLHWENHFFSGDEGYYYEARDMDTGNLDIKEKSARFIYLNKTCYNGLYRVNKEGGFNVPKGSYKSPPNICDADNLLEVWKILLNYDISHLSYNCLDLTEGDFVYCDPPYHGSYTGYTKEGFDEIAQKELSYWAKQCDRNGAKIMLSNSNTEFIRVLYKDFYIDEIDAPRTINCKGEGRKRVNELVIRSYKT